MKIKEVSTFKSGSVDINIWKWQKALTALPMNTSQWRFHTKNLKIRMSVMFNSPLLQNKCIITEQREKKHLFNNAGKAFQ